MKQTAFDEDLLTRYLLGELPEEEQTRVEEGAFKDPETLTQLLAVENDLIDEYARGELTGEARRGFERKFLNSEERRRKIEFAGTLIRLDPASIGVRATAGVRETPAFTASLNNASQNNSAPASRWKSFLPALARFPLVPRLSFAALFIIVLIGGALFFVNRQTDDDRSIVQRTEQTSPRPAPTPDIAEGVAPTPQIVRPPAAAVAPTPQTPEHAQNRQPFQQDRNQASPTPKGNRPAPSGLSIAAVLVFSSGMTRGGSDQAKQLVLPSTPRAGARLSFALEKGDEYRSYRVELRTADGSLVLQSGPLAARAARAGRSSVSLNVPASKLPAGSYEALLRGVHRGERSQLIGAYYFDVVKR